MKTGIKIPYDMFLDEHSKATEMLLDGFGGREGYLSYLATELTAVEVGVVFHDTDGVVLKNAVAKCKEYGLLVSIHGGLNEVENAQLFFKPYLPLFQAGLQECYNITVHPFENPEETKKLLAEICQAIEKNGYPVCIMLENQRYTRESLKDTLCKNVAQIVREINSPYLYCCFDFGHQLYNQINYGDAFDPTEAEFLSLVKHTHIHSLYGEQTHFPLSCGKTMLEENIRLLKHYGYDGVYLLELAPARYLREFDIKASIEDSLRILKTALL